MLRNRLIVLGLFILSLIAISFYGGPVTYGFFFLMLLVPIFSISYCYLVYFRFRILQQIVTKNVVAGTPTDYYFRLQNEDFYTFSGIKVEFFSDFSNINELADNYEYEIPPHSGLKNETLITCKYRGEYDVGIRNIIVTDYFKIFKFNFMNRENLRATVLPRLEILESLSHEYSQDIYKDSNINPNVPDVLVREYIPGDDIRNINWKMSAHLGKPYVRTKTGEETPNIGIIMDSCRYSKKPEDHLPLENKILETTLALSHYYLSKGIQASVYAYEKEPKKYHMQNISSFEDFYAAMSDFSFDEDNTGDKLFQAAHMSNVTSSSLVYLIVHEVNDACLFAVDELIKTSTPVIICHINDENYDLSADLGKNTIYKRIGYEDKLKEVL